MANPILLIISISSLLLSFSAATPAWSDFQGLEELNNVPKATDPKVVEICKVVPVKKTCTSAYYIAGGDNKAITPEKVLMKQMQATRLVASWLAGQLGNAKRGTKLPAGYHTCKESLSEIVARTEEAEEGATQQNNEAVKHNLGLAMGQVVACEEAVLDERKTRDDEGTMKNAGKVLQEMVDNCITLADNIYESGTM